MNRQVQAVLLLLVGGLAVRLVLSGAYLNYVKPSLGIPLLVSGVLLVLLALWSIVRDGFVGRTAHPLPEDEDGHGHAHGDHGPRAAWMLLLPVFTVFLVAPPALGSYAAQRDSANVVAPSDPSEMPPLPGSDPVEVTVPDYAVRAVWDNGRTLDGRTVRMIGFVTPADDGGWWLTRMTLQCCAADAFAYKVLAVDAPDMAADTWVEVLGTWTPGGGTQTEDAIPWVKVESVTPIAPPAEPYA